MGLDHLLDDRKAQPRTFGCLAGRPSLAHLIESLEDLLLFVGWDSDPCIGHPETYRRILIVRAYRDRPARLSELHPISHEIRKHLHQFSAIDLQPDVARSELDIDPYLLPLGSRPQFLNREVHDLVQVALLDLKIQSTGLHSRQIQQVLDQRSEPVRALPYAGQRVRLKGAQPIGPASARHIVQIDPHGSQWRSQLVRNIGQKLRLQPVHLPEFHVRLLQLPLLCLQHPIRARQLLGTLLKVPQRPISLLRVSLQFARHVLERVGQFPDLISTPYRYLDIPVPSGDQMGPLHQSLHRPYDRPRGQTHDGGSCDHHDHECQQQGPPHHSRRMVRLLSGLLENRVPPQLGLEHPRVARQPSSRLILEFHTPPDVGADHRQLLLRRPPLVDHVLPIRMREKDALRGDHIGDAVLPHTDPVHKRPHVPQVHPSHERAHHPPAAEYGHAQHHGRRLRIGLCVDAHVRPVEHPRPHRLLKDPLSLRRYRNVLQIAARDLTTFRIQKVDPL